MARLADGLLAEATRLGDQRTEEARREAERPELATPRITLVRRVTALARRLRTEADPDSRSDYAPAAEAALVELEATVGDARAHTAAALWDVTGDLLRALEVERFDDLVAGQHLVKSALEDVRQARARLGEVVGPVATTGGRYLAGLKALHVQTVELFVQAWALSLGNTAARAALVGPFVAAQEDRRRRLAAAVPNGGVDEDGDEAT